MLQELKMKILNLIIIGILLSGLVIAGVSLSNTPDISTDITKVNEDDQDLEGTIKPWGK